MGRSGVSSRSSRWRTSSQRWTPVLTCSSTQTRREPDDDAGPNPETVDFLVYRQQVEALHRATHAPRLECLCIYGGTPYGPQQAALRGGVDVVVATPGRTIDHLTRGSLSLQDVSMLSASGLVSLH